MSQESQVCILFWMCVIEIRAMGYCVLIVIDELFMQLQFCELYNVLYIILNCLLQLLLKSFHTLDPELR